MAKGRNDMKYFNKSRESKAVIVLLSCLMAVSLTACSGPKNPFSGGGVSAGSFLGGNNGSESGDGETQGQQEIFSEEGVYTYDFTSLSTGDNFTVSVPKDSGYTLKCGDNAFAVMKEKTEVLLGGFSDASAFDSEVNLINERGITPIEQRDNYLYFLYASDVGPEYDRAICYHNTCILIASTEPQEDGDAAYKALSIVPKSTQN